MSKGIRFDGVTKVLQDDMDIEEISVTCWPLSVFYERSDLRLG